MVTFAVQSLASTGHKLTSKICEEDVQTKRLKQFDTNDFSRRIPCPENDQLQLFCADRRKNTAYLGVKVDESLIMKKKPLAYLSFLVKNGRQVGFSSASRLIGTPVVFKLPRKLKHHCSSYYTDLYSNYL